MTAVMPLPLRLRAADEDLMPECRERVLSDLEQEAG